MTALDNRAITYMQLGNLVSALRDAKRMIQVDKCSSMVRNWKVSKPRWKISEMTRVISARAKYFSYLRMLKGPCESANTASLMSPAKIQTMESVCTILLPSVHSNTPSTALVFEV